MTKRVMGFSAENSSKREKKRFTQKIFIYKTEKISNRYTISKSQSKSCINKKNKIIMSYFI